MELYEIMLIIRPDLEMEDHKDVLDGLSKVITKNEGTVSTVLDWRKRRLSYEIEKHKDGHYYLVYLSAPVTIIPEIEHYFRVTDAIIRFMIVRSSEEDFEEAARKASADASEPKEESDIIEPINTAEMAEENESAENEDNKEAEETVAEEPVGESAETALTNEKFEKAEPEDEEEVTTDES